MMGEENEMYKNVEDTIIAQAGHKDKDGLFCLRELFSLIPPKHEFALPSGAVGKIVVSSVPHVRDGEVMGMIDVNIKGGACDHFGFSVKLTDSGGWVVGEGHVVGEIKETE